MSNLSIGNDSKQLNLRLDSFIRLYDEGFIWSEIELILKEYPDLNRRRFEDALNGVTGCVGTLGEFIFYVWDVKKAFQCVLGNRAELTEE